MKVSKCRREEKKRKKRKREEEEGKMVLCLMRILCHTAPNDTQGLCLSPKASTRCTLTSRAAWAGKPSEFDGGTIFHLYNLFTFSFSLSSSSSGSFLCVTFTYRFALDFPNCASECSAPTASSRRPFQASWRIHLKSTSTKQCRWSRYVLPQRESVLCCWAGALMSWCWCNVNH